jgi:enamine deaminase RidA (YjgF/YER057c/UK114 family)
MQLKHFGVSKAGAGRNALSFGAHPPARACVKMSMKIDCKVEIDCIAYGAA